MSILGTPRPGLRCDRQFVRFLGVLCTTPAARTLGLSVMSTRRTTLRQSRVTWRIRGPCHAHRVGTKERPVDRGTRLGRRLISVSGSDLRLARVSVGLSLTEVGRAVGMSQSQVGRIERASHPAVSVMQLARIASVVGLDLSLRTYPNGSPFRDKAHLALIERFHRRISPILTVRREVPVPIAGDLRAWDLMIFGAGEPIAVEAETRLADLQALERKIALKVRDSGVGRVVLLVSGSRGNHHFVRQPSRCVNRSRSQASWRLRR